MNFFNQPHKFYCGIDLHARTMYLCILDQDGNIRLHQNAKARPEDFLRLLKPFREGVVVAVECMFSWYWLADLCAEEGIKFVLGHALYMKAIHGGKAKNDRIDSHKIAVLLRGGNFPLAYVYPRKMRATRDLLRRRMHMARKRAELLGHIENTNTQYCLPRFSKKLSYKINREGVLDHFTDPIVQKSIEVDLSLIDHYDQLLNDMELTILRSAREHDAQSLHLLRTIPGIGKILSLVILYEIHDIGRFPTVQDFSSYARLVKCPRESAGKLHGTQGNKIGNPYLKWAFSEAAVSFLRLNPRGQKYLCKMEQKFGKAKALSILAHKLGRCVYFMLDRGKAFDAEKFYSS